MHTNKLSEEAFNQTFQVPMQDVMSTAAEVLNIWPYVDEIPVADLDGFAIRDVSQVYLNPSGLFEHVLIGTEDKNVFLVIRLVPKQKALKKHVMLNAVKHLGRFIERCG